MRPGQEAPDDPGVYDKVGGALPLASMRPGQEAPDDPLRQDMAALVNQTLQ